MITDFFIEEYNLEYMWLQQYGAICNTTQANMALLQETFSARVISHRGDINWPPKTCGLTPLDLFVGLCEISCLCNMHGMCIKCEKKNGKIKPQRNQRVKPIQNRYSFDLFIYYNTTINYLQFTLL